MTRKITMMLACSAVALAPVAPLSAQTDAKGVTAAVQQQWVPATQAEQQEARGGARKTLPPKIRAIIKKIVCKKRNIGC